MTTDRHVSTAGPLRLFRGSVVGTCVSGFATWAHLLAGGALPPPVLWLLLSVLCVAVAVLASRWRWRVTSLAGAMLLAQAGSHAAFAAYGGPPGQHQPGHLLAGSTSGHTLPDVLLPDGPMLVLHLSAALVLAILLRLGEDVLRDTLDVLGFRVARTLAGALAGVPEVNRRLGVTSQVVLVAGGPARACWSRGPPR